MTIGAAWNIDDPEKPWTLWDSNANVKIPIGVGDWLTDLSATYGSHEVIADAPLLCVSEGTHAAGTIEVRMALVASPTFVSGTKYPFTLRITGADGITVDDRTLWLKVTSR